jgi:hypothetical protein
MESQLYVGGQNWIPNASTAVDDMLDDVVMEAEVEDAERMFVDNRTQSSKIQEMYRACAISTRDAWSFNFGSDPSPSRMRLQAEIGAELTYAVLETVTQNVDTKTPEGRATVTSIVRSVLEHKRLSPFIRGTDPRLHSDVVQKLFSAYRMSQTSEARLEILKYIRGALGEHNKVTYESLRDAGLPVHPREWAEAGKQWEEFEAGLKTEEVERKNGGNMSAPQRVDTVAHAVRFLTDEGHSTAMTWRTVRLKTSKGWCMVAARLRKHTRPQLWQAYMKECAAAQHSGLSKTQFKKVIRAVCRGQLKSLAGLDNTSETCGREAFETARDVVTRLRKCDIEDFDEDAVALLAAIDLAELYYKTQFKRNLSADSPVASHCLHHLLSEPDSIENGIDCDHSHDDRCQLCELYPAVLKSMRSAFTSCSDELSDAEQRFFEKRLSELEDSHQRYVGHLCREVWQKLEFDKIVADLPQGTAILHVDYAMNWVERLHREAQEGWYAKAGIVWAGGYLVYTDAAGKPVQKHLHLIQGNDRGKDQFAAMSFIQALLSETKSMAPHIKHVILASDNAGAFAGNVTRLLLRSLGGPVGRPGALPTVVAHWNPDAQDGKGVIDAGFGLQKGILRRLVACGQDADSPGAVVRMLRSEAMDNHVVKLMFIDRSKERVLTTARKGLKGLAGVRKISHVEYGECNVTVWHQSALGTGHVYTKKQWEEMSGVGWDKHVDTGVTVKDHENQQAGPAQAVPPANQHVQPVPVPLPAAAPPGQRRVPLLQDRQLTREQLIEKRNRQRERKAIETLKAQAERNERKRRRETTRLQYCGICQKRYRSLPAFDEHVRACRTIDRRTIAQTAADMAAEVLCDTSRTFSAATYFTDESRVTDEMVKLLDEYPVDAPPQGWGTKMPPLKNHWTEEIKEFLYELFWRGERHKGSKVRAKEALVLIQDAVTDDGDKRFEEADYPTEKMIKARFSALAKDRKSEKLRHEVENDDSTESEKNTDSGDSDSDSSGSSEEEDDDEDDEEEEKSSKFDVERIVQHKKDGSKNLFLVKWKGFPESANTWEPFSNLNELAKQEARKYLPMPRTKSK